MIDCQGWREQLVAGWMVAVNQRRQHLPALAGALLRGGGPHQEGGPIAPASLPSRSGTEALVTYLKRSWPQIEVASSAWCRVFAAVEVADPDRASAVSRPWDAALDGDRASARAWIASALDLLDECRRPS